MWQKLKDINLKAAMRVFAVLWMVILIIVMTITNIGIDKSFDWIKWLGNSMILFGITVFGLLLGESAGIDFQKNRPNGLFKMALKAYDEFRRTIDEIIIYFPLFYDWYVPQRIEHSNIEFLTRGGMHVDKARNIVKYCSAEDFEDLKTHAIEKQVGGKTIYIKKLLEKEVEPTRMVLFGEVKFKQSGSAYYLQALAESNQADIMEVGEVIRESRARRRKLNRIVRITAGVLISLGIGLLAVNEIMKGNDAQGWMNLVSRLSNLFTALLSGYLSGVDDVIKQADAIENKTEVLKIFKVSYDKHLFEIYDEEESAKREYEQYQKELEEAKKNVVEPEIVPGSVDNQLPFDPLQIEEKDDEKL